MAYVIFVGKLAVKNIGMELHRRVMSSGNTGILLLYPAIFMTIVIINPVVLWRNLSTKNSTGTY